jgi:hypothetical protein
MIIAYYRTRDMIGVYKAINSVLVKQIPLSSVKMRKLKTNNSM